MFSEYTEKIMDFYTAHKRMPVYSEIMKLVGFKSRNAVYKLINKMIDAGLVSKDASGKLIPAQAFGEIPMLGTVTAGLPAMVDPQLLGAMSIDEFLVDKKGSTYILEVDGDSMIEAHIADGDMVLAERTKTAKDGDIVIAEVDSEWTMKYFRQKGGKVWLEPANKKYKPIYPEQTLNIAAKVRAVFRKYDF